MGFWNWFKGRAPAKPVKTGAAEAVVQAQQQPAAAQPVVVFRAGQVDWSVGEPQAALALALLHELPPPWAEFEPERVASLACVAALDAVLREPGLDERWLPRAASLIPQLMRLLRQPNVSPIELEARVSRDVILSAEVLHMAGSSYYASRGPVRDLSDALVRLGEVGLQRAMARVVLRPLFNPDADPAIAPLQALLQRHVDWQAEALAHGAVLQGLEPFDGYLAGLLHGAGWQALMRIVSAANAWPSAAPRPELAQALAGRAHRLFGRAALAWDLSPAFAGFAASAAQGRSSASDALSQAWARSQAQSPVLS
jgi:hypothetical protein